MTRTLVGCLLIALLLGPLVGSAGAAVPSTDASSLPGNNSTTQHVDPADADGDGNLEGLESHLARQLAGRLGNSSVQISQGQYEQANELLGDDYQDDLGKYVDVAGETDGGGDGTEFREAREQQRDYTNQTRDYRETHEEYQEARENGNEQRAREKARELQRDAEQIRRASRNLTGSYRTIENASGVDMQNATDTINGTTADINAQQTAVVEATFVRTTISVTASDERVSFQNPIQLEGRIRTDNGTAVSNQQGRLRFNGRTYAIQTNGDGEFTLDYRPVQAATGDRTFQAVFRPQNDSVYLGSNTTVDVTVEAVSPQIDIEQAPQTARYQESITASGEVTAANAAVPGVPVALIVGDQRLATGLTDADGSYRLWGTLPADVPAGDQVVTVQVAQQDRAIAQNATSQPLRVEPTATNISVNAVSNGETATLSGRLVTDSGWAVASRPVEIRLNGSVVTTTQTGPDGNYSATVSPDSDHYRASVVYDEPGTNLKPSSARQTFVLGSADTNGETGDSGEGIDTIRGLVGQLLSLVRASPFITAGVLAGLLMVVVSVFAWRYRGRGDALDDDTVIPAITPIDDTGASTPVAEKANGIDDRLEIAKQHLNAADTDAAVETAYRAVRERFTAEGFISREATHTEARDAYRANGHESLDAVETLTDIYERAAFGPTAVASEEAAEALSAAEELT